MGRDLGAASPMAVPLAELVSFLHETARQLGQQPWDPLR